MAERAQLDAGADPAHRKPLGDSLSTLAHDRGATV